MAKRSVEADAAAMMRRLLDAVEKGALEPGGAQGVALLRRMEGAAVALEAVAGAGARSADRQAPA